MTESNQETEKNQAEQKPESGTPDSGKGRVEDVSGSGVYPMSGPHPSEDVPVQTPGSWGEGDRDTQAGEASQKTQK